MPRRMPTTSQLVRKGRNAPKKKLATQGAAVAVAARRRDRLDALVAAIEGEGGRAIAIEADVTDQHQAIGAVERTVEELGRLDVVINNAGVMLLGPILDAPIDEWDTMVNVNVFGLLYVAKASIPHLLKAADGEPREVADLVNISSVAGRVARSGSAVYNATKHAVGAFSEGMRQEVTGRHVRVSLIEPGAVATELSSHNREEILTQIKQRFSDMDRLEAEDIADAIGYVVTRPRHVAINEVLIRPTEQEQ